MLSDTTTSPTVKTMAVTPPSLLTGVGPAARTTAGDAATETEQFISILVVDDNPMWRELMVLYLDQIWPLKKQPKIDGAADGAEALVKLQTNRYELVFLDWNLPVLSEGAVLRHMRQRGIQTPVVVISCVERAEIVEDLEALHAAFVNKDQIAETLEAGIAQACGCSVANWRAGVWHPPPRPTAARSG